ncbi:MAG TPA: hypothetical protein VE982_04015 [Gaiellaceae bacterium]|nr:hypothetical protein [Gaiellaceae bacterium]
MTAALVAALLARAGGAVATTSFRTPDAGAACRARGAALVCTSLASRASVRLAAAAATVVPATRWWDASTPVLRRWRRTGVDCTLVRAAIVCTSGRTAIRVDRSGFAVAG